MPHLTTTQAARVLGVSKRTVCRMVNAGELPTRRTPGGHARIARDDLDAILHGDLAASARPDASAPSPRRCDAVSRGDSAAVATSRESST